MSDTATAPTPTPVEAPAVEQAPPGQRSTGGDRGAPRAPASGITRERAGDILRQAYGRQAEMQGQQADSPTPSPAESGQPSTRPAPTPETRERGTNGRFLPRQQAQVDTPARPAVQEPSTATPPRSAPPGAPPAKPAAPVPEARPAGASPSSAPPEVAPSPPDAVPQAVDDREEQFRTARWQRVFQADPSLRTTVRRITRNDSLTEGQRSAQLAEKLADGEKAADAADWRASQMVNLRRTDPQAYIRQVEADEAEAEASNQLALRITQMIAEAYEVDPDDPDFLEAGPREGDDRVEGLRRFVEYTSAKSPIFKGALKTALEAQAAEHAKAVEALKAQHKLDVEAALERGRSQARSPYGRNGAPPRSTGTRVVPVGQDEGPGGGPRVPARVPTVAGIRDLINAGYQQREPA